MRGRAGNQESGIGNPESESESESQFFGFLFFQFNFVMLPK